MATIFGTNGNDYRAGTSSNDIIYGLGGFDTLDGQGGNDDLYGNEQGDILFGGSGLDELYGGQGNDSLDGGNENDGLFGDSDNDTLRGGNGTDTLTGGSGADLFLPSGSDSITDFSSPQGDSVGFAGFSAFSSTSSFSDFALSNSSNTQDIPYFIELTQRGDDLLIGDSWSQGHVTLLGSGEEINNLDELLPSLHFSYGAVIGHSTDDSESKISSEDSDPLTGLQEHEAILTQAIEQLEAGGSLYDLGFQGEGLDTLKPEDLQGALAEVQGRIANELAQQEQADSLLLPESDQVVKQVFLVEEGTIIPPELQKEMAGDEIFLLPTGYFSSSVPESLF